MWDFSHRRRQPEMMDQPGLDEQQHWQALRALERINKWSFSQRPIWHAIVSVSARTEGPELTVLDVASGGGDTIIQLASQATIAGKSLRFSGCDLSPTAIAYAQGRAAQSGVDVQFFQHDALEAAFPGQYDVVMCSLFLHHLSDEQALVLLQRMAAAARQVVLVDDLRRTRVGYAMAHVACRLLTRSPVVHADGPISVRAAFTPAEALALAHRAGLRDAAIHTHWPQRFLLQWKRYA